MKRFSNIIFKSSKSPKAKEVATILQDKYGIKEAETIQSDPDTLVIALGGDGFMLSVLQDSIKKGYSTYGINCGTLGFLLNKFDPDDLESDIGNAVSHTINVLQVEITTVDGLCSKLYAINDFYILRNCVKASKLRVSINGQIAINSLAGDGIIISTPLGSTAYCLAAGGSILPLESNNMCLVPINPCMPCNSKPAILNDSSIIEVEVLEHDKRTVLVAADSNEIHRVQKARVSIDKEISPVLLLKKGQTISEKILAMQFHE